MIRISSNATLLLKIFLPTLWIVFFGLFTLAVWVTNALHFTALPQVYFKLSVLFFFLLGSFGLYFTVIQLKRVDLDDLHVYASNYFNTYRYPFHNIESITERDIGFCYLINIQLKTPGKFGKKLTFLLDMDMWKSFLEQKPNIAGQLKGIRMEERQ